LNRPFAIPARISDLLAPLTAEEEREIDAYRSAANDRSVVQISDNPLLREALKNQARQTAVPRRLGNNAGTQFHSRSLESDHQEAHVNAIFLSLARDM